MFGAFFIVAIPFVFAGWLIDRVFKHRAMLRQIEATQYQAALPPASPEVEQRLRNLEAIVTSTDYEIASKFPSRDPRAA